jgi:hypothetical protein
MAFFQKTPADLIEADLKASRKKRVTTEQRLQYAEAQLAEYRATVEKLTNDVAENSAVAAASASVAGAEVEVQAWQNSLADIDAKILDLEDAEKEIANQKLRAETAAAIRVIIKESTDDSAALNVAIEKRIKSARRAAALIPDAAGIVNYLLNAQGELPLADAFTAQLLESRAVATIAGTAPAALAVPEQIAQKQKAVPPAPITARYFLSRNLAWFDAQGGKHSAPSCTDFDLPVGLITKATELGAIHAMDSDVRKKNHGGKSQSSKPAFEHCLWLNSDPTAKSNVTPIMSSHLGNLQVTVGTPIVGTMRSQPAMANTRTDKPQS